jgi:hypothetical protein
MRSLRTLLAVGLLGLTAACSSANFGRQDLTDMNYRAADRIVEQTRKSKDPVGPVLVSNFVDITDLKKTTAFGRISADQMGSRLAQMGLSVVETRMTGQLAIRPDGEFALSRELKEIAAQHDARAILVGTYTFAGFETYVSTRLVRLADGMVVASHDYTFTVNPENRALMK